MNFANQAAFEDPISRQLAMGVDLNPAKALPTRTAMYCSTPRPEG